MPRLLPLFLTLVAGVALAARSADVLSFTMDRIDGTPQALSEYRGKVLLLVNVASKCGLTPQYEALEAMYEEYEPRGFAVLGFPSNDFRGQEPGTNAEIAEFCRSTYGVKFPMFAKIHVKGADAHPLYRQLTALPEPIGGPIQWNFQKYLVDRSGGAVARYESATQPGDPDLVGQIERLLEAPAPSASATPERLARPPTEPTETLEK